MVYSIAMTTITIPKKEYLDLKRKQEQIVSEIFLLKAAIREVAKDELHPSFVKKLEKQSKLLDRGEGKLFSNFGAFRKYLRVL